MANAPSRVVELVKTFERHVEAYRSQQYNETQLRREFIDPLFEQLGWDVSNKAGYAQAYKDVIHEDAIKIGGATKAPDYSFRIGGVRKFFLEAKKPSVDIKGDPHPAYQLRRYAWSAKLPLSVLTDFEEFAVYDCLTRPKYTDRADVARIMFFGYKDYLKKWPEIAAIFSKEAILKGSFDKFAAATKGKRGTSTVDKEFLAEIEKWRSMLARIIALRNRTLSIREINFGVQRTIDRILFLRMCEDRGIEPYGQLQSISSGERTYPRLREVFEKADQRYNSGLFHFHDEPGRHEPPDELTPKLIIDDKDLKWILHSLYYPQSPYEFSVLPAEILGNVYEQFLGKVITLTTGHRASVEDKPEVKKAGGVYYTPSYIVDYIVKNTVGRLLGDFVIPSAAEESAQTGHSERGEEYPSSIVNRNSKFGNLKSLTPKQVSNVKILDPACGSGSFLIGAYQYLLDWHLRYYTQNNPEKHTKGREPKICQVTACHSGQSEESQSANYRLTIAEKKRILLNNIFGVDIDSQAVEVTKLSLLLKVLEGESSETIENQYRLFHERALPDLAANIKCGNSLIGPEFFDTDVIASAVEESAKTGRSRASSCHSRESGNLDDLRHRINAFDWHAEFPEIFSRQNPGFDAVIGNPPWGQKGISFDEATNLYLRSRYTSVTGILDIFRPFVECGIMLTLSGGMFGMVLPDIILLKDYESTRRYILRNLTITKIDWWGMAFPSAVIDASTIIGQKKISAENHLVAVGVHDPEHSLSHEVPQSDFKKNPRCVFNLFLTGEKRKILEDLDGCAKVGDCFEIHEGVHSGNIRNELFVDEAIDDTCRPLLFGRDEITPYHLKWNGRYIRLSAVPEKKTKQRYANAGKPEWYAQEKLLVRRTGDFVLAALDSEKRYASNNFFILFPKITCSLDLAGLCAVLNSKIATWYFRTIEPRKGRVFAELKIKHLSVFPIPPCVRDADGCKALNELARERIALAERAFAAKTPHQRREIVRICVHLDQKIDDLVINLLGIEKPPELKTQD
jgi:Eco57I restriction-modification methylase/TaqI-like C-terminal specificity domain/Type I restriction enzyme R protein N terminus (HSDR_N)